MAYRGVQAILIGAALSIVSIHGDTGSPPQSLPLDVSVPFRPTLVKALGRTHLLYELRITNFRTAPVELVRIEVLAHDASIQNLQETDLDTRLSRPGVTETASKRTLGAGLTAIVFLDVVLDENPSPILRHRLHVKVDGGASSEMTLIAAETAVDPVASLTVEPPLHGESWVALNGLSNESTHRRTVIVVDGKATIAQRFATDWTRLGRDGQAFHDDPSNNANWYAYGAEVRSVSDGIVTDLQDGIPENNPTLDQKAVAIDLQTAPGNYLILQLAPNRYALYAHLQPGSLRVRRGDHVRTGQSLALLGNSGNSDAPHLHFHICDANSALRCEGVPYVIDRFALLGVLPSLAVLTNGTGWKPDGQPAAERILEIPVRNAVVRFR